MQLAGQKYYDRIVICSLLIIFFCLLFESAKAQEEKSKWLLGAGVTYDNYMSTPGINLNVTYRLIGNLHIGPDFSALLNREEKDNGVAVLKKELEYNFNANYLYKVSERWSLYPLAGVNFSKVTVHPVNGEANKKLITAWNTGAGFEIELKSFRIFFESKYVTQLDKYDLTLGTLFKL